MRVYTVAGYRVASVTGYRVASVTGYRVAFAIGTVAAVVGVGCAVRLHGYDG